MDAGYDVADYYKIAPRYGTNDDAVRLFEEVHKRDMHILFDLRELDESERKVAFAFILSMPGAPFIYYGDEIGMNYVEGLTSVEGGYFRTGSRTPMQWDNSLPNAGFSTADASKLYIRQDDTKNRPAVKTELEREDSLVNEIKKQIAIRQDHVALQSNASVEFLTTDKNQYPLIYTREAENEKIVVIINPSGKEVATSIPVKPLDCIYDYNGRIDVESTDEAGAYMITVPAESAGYYIF